MRPTVISRRTVAPVLMVTLGSVAAAAQEPAQQPARAIPGITADDPHPQACVSCHTVLPDGMDVRISTLLDTWMEGADSALVALSQSATPPGVTLTGTHPKVAATDIPSGCMVCHSLMSRTVPPFSRLMHRIHLTGGEENVFLSMFGGECTYCHKLDRATGEWSIPSGPEP